MIDYKEIYGSSLGLIQSPYDNRDYKFKDLIPMAAMIIPDNYESEIPPFIYDQGQSSMCCACAYNTIRFMQERSKEQSELTEPLSPCFTYGNRKQGHDYEGMLLRECCKKGRDGSVLLTELPHFCSQPKAKKYVTERKDELLEKAKPYSISSFYTCSTRKEIQAATINTEAVLIGIPVYDCFYTPDKNGHILYNPTNGEQNSGGHAQVLCGWKTDENGKLWWKLINSWGNKWGVKGISWLPEDYPWMDEAYALVDEISEMKFKEYKDKYCRE